MCQVVKKTYILMFAGFRFLSVGLLEQSMRQRLPLGCGCHVDGTIGPGDSALCDARSSGPRLFPCPTARPLRAIGLPSGVACNTPADTFGALVGPHFAEKSRILLATYDGSERLKAIWFFRPLLVVVVATCCRDDGIR